MGLVAPHLAFASLIAVIGLASGAVDAQAVTYGFTVSPASPNEGEVTTFQLTPAGASLDRVRWDLDGDGDFDDGTTRTVSRTYASPGSVTVQMRARETRGSQFQTVTKTIAVNGRPAADFGATPSDPVEGAQVAFTPAVTDP